MKLRIKCFVTPPVCVQWREKLNKVSNGFFFQVLLLFFLFVMAFSTTFFLLLDDETVRRFNHYRIVPILITVPSEKHYSRRKTLMSHVVYFLFWLNAWSYGRIQRV